MSKKRSDALQALIAEIVDLDRELVRARANEEGARTEFTFARQQLDMHSQNVKDLDARRSTTVEALRLIQLRDEISHETVDALLARAARS